ncbi:hypothetical protein TVAG_277490 [Trichomonas vaginalis G3]|uniref:Aminotransferase class V domain-containing protein n=1 Tax=Trichomonas vaginalis (strain ATCC PRA-98 / G3) TaxID=412133 RepID=A2FTV8_TRIV3|nr:molybdenum cofactor sulfurtransferase protein [Trichomonas vaginalis G3]EAX91679.1 hypothetical protein TVAG_277490 [Trichomonas vaginalis G3]KAI5487257.1 molybdenum cofactor sulfurtransferase protein [Trichomonas vaginalis G3]|eukprot:XP_001304609.1 hypothetical protein [Trichomonas vaginalis G3]
MQGRSYMDYFTKPLHSPQQIHKHSLILINNLFGNTHSDSKSATISHDTITNLRSKILTLLNTTYNHYTVIFTHSSTQSIKTALETFTFNETSKLQLICDEKSELPYLSQVISNKNIKRVIRNDAKIDYTPIKTNDLVFISPFINGSLLTIDEIKTIIKRSHEIGNTTFVGIDATHLISNYEIDLEKLNPDFFIFDVQSFIGYPRLGVLLVNNDLITSNLLEKPYFGGGSLVYALTESPHEKLKLFPSERFEDGSLPFLTTAAADEMFSAVSEINKFRVERISKISEYAREKLSKINNCKVYGKSGSIILFDVLDSNRKAVDALNFAKFAYNSSVDISVYNNHSMASFGWLSTEQDIDKLVDVINKYLN